MDFFLPIHYPWLPVAAFLLDMFLGDPHWLPHPVNLQGRLFSLLEKPLLKARARLRAAGALALLLALAVTAAAVTLLLNIPALPQLVSPLIAVYLGYSGLALGCLLREGAKACSAIDAAPEPSPNPLPEGEPPEEAPVASPQLFEARRAVSMLVSRDVSRLDKPALYRTLAESLSENFTDAFVAPFFWLLAGGPLGLWLYKCASTADSRWGYKHEPWRLRGWAGARLDDVLAYVPARLAALFLYLGAVSGANPAGGQRAEWPGWKKLRLEAGKMESPNAGWSMAACAWLHGAFMGGPAVYAGKVKEKPVLGPPGLWDGKKIDDLLRHLRFSGLLGAVALAALPALVFALARLICR